MGVDGKDIRSYANWAYHTHNQSKSNTEIRKVDQRLLLVLIKAIPPNMGRFLSPMDVGIFSRSSVVCPE